VLQVVGQLPEQPVDGAAGRMRLVVADIGQPCECLAVDPVDDQPVDPL